MTKKENHIDRLAEQQIKDDVKKFGWHVGLFEPTDTEVSFAYTIGLWESYQHPELISFGLTINTLHAILNNAGQKIKDGQRLRINQNDFEILENLPVQFLTVDQEKISDYFGYCMWYNNYKDFPALQLVWTDRKGQFPWQSRFDIEFVGKQPILNKEFEQKIREGSS